LNTPDPRETLERLMQQRAPLYDETADLTVDTDGRRVGTVVEEIERRLAEARGS
jgi:shikimate kinase